MIQQQTILKVADNSGAKTVKCIKVLNKSKCGKIGDVIVVSVKKAQSVTKAKKVARLKTKEIFKAVIVSTRFPFRSKNGFSKIFKENSVAIIDKQLNPVGTRINGFLLKNLRKKYSKLVILSKNLV